MTAVALADVPPVTVGGRVIPLICSQNPTIGSMSRAFRPPRASLPVPARAAERSQPGNTGRRAGREDARVKGGRTLHWKRADREASPDAFLLLWASGEDRVLSGSVALAHVHAKVTG